MQPTKKSIQRRMKNTLSGKLTFHGIDRERAEGLRQAYDFHCKLRAHDKSGSCHQVAWYLCILEDNTLVHALIKMDGQTAFHAWCEKAGL